MLDASSLVVSMTQKWAGSHVDRKQEGSHRKGSVASKTHDASGTQAPLPDTCSDLSCTPLAPAGELLPMDSLESAGGLPPPISHPTTEFQAVKRTAIGSGLESRPPIHNPGVWLGSGVGRAFFGPNLTGYAQIVRAN